MVQATVYDIKDRKSLRPLPGKPGLSKNQSERQAKLADEFTRLEGIITDIVSMATLTTDAVSSCFTAANKEVTHQDDCYFVELSHVDATVFAINHLRGLISNLEKQFYAAFGEER